MIPLVSAERSWSQAMELKAQLEKESMSYKRQHMVRDLVALYDLSPFSSLLGCVLDHAVTSNSANRMHSPHVVDCNPKSGHGCLARPTDGMFGAAAMLGMYKP